MWVKLFFKLHIVVILIFFYILVLTVWVQKALCSSPTLNISIDNYNFHRFTGHPVQSDPSGESGVFQYPGGRAPLPLHCGHQDTWVETLLDFFLFFVFLILWKWPKPFLTHFHKFSEALKCAYRCLSLLFLSQLKPDNM